MKITKTKVYSIKEYNGDGEVLELFIAKTKAEAIQIACEVLDITKSSFNENFFLEVENAWGRS